MSEFTINLTNVAKASDLLTLEGRVAFLEANPETLINVVSDYASLPDVTTVSGEFYWVSNSSGTSWLPGNLGGTYRQKGLYFSNGVSWEFTPVPYQATQTEVSTGTNTDKFVTPATLEGIKPILQGLDTEEDVRKISAMTDAEYSLITPDPKTIYFLEDSSLGWERYVDTVNTQTLTANIENLFNISGSSLSNGGSNLIDSSTDKVTPNKLNDYIQIDVSFTVETPAGTNHWLELSFIVNGFIYRSSTQLLVKGSGVDDTISFSFGLPVESTFLTNGGTFSIKPSVGLTIKNKYLSVIEIYKGL